MLWEEAVYYDQCMLMEKANSVSLCPASFYTPRPKLACYYMYLLLLTFAFQSPRMKRTPFFVVVVSSEGLGGLHRTIQLQRLQH